MEDKSSVRLWQCPPLRQWLTLHGCNVLRRRATWKRGRTLRGQAKLDAAKNSSVPVEACKTCPGVRLLYARGKAQAPRDVVLSKPETRPRPRLEGESSL